MKISAIEPISPAWDKMVHILFKPFDFKKWLVLGFCAFLARCGEGSGSSGSPGGGGGGGNSGSSYTEHSVPEMKAWIHDHLETIILVGSAIFTVGLFLAILITWLSSRGKFMFLDGVVKNRTAVKEPWAEFKREGNSLCIWSIIIRLTAFALFASITVIAFMIAWPDIESETFGSPAINALIVGGGSFFMMFIAFILLDFFIKIFVVPTMYLNRMSFKDAASVAYSKCVSGHKFSAFCLLCMLFVLGIATTSIAIAVTCLTCCVASLPYISSVVFLPISVFFTCYILYYLEQFGDDWKFFPKACLSCGYSLEGLNKTSICPECGKNGG